MKGAMRGTALCALVLVGAACGESRTNGGSESAGGGMGEMDHSQHSAGAPATREAVRLTSEQERALGVRYQTVSRRTLERTIRTVGRIEASESRVVDVTPKVEGFVEVLSVSTTGESVRAGQPLLTLYSPDLVAAQEELLTAMRLVDRVDPAAEGAMRDARSVLESARRRLTYWDITDEQVRLLEERGEVTKTLTLVSPVDGVVLDKRVNEGQRVTPGMLLYRIVDLSEVWVEGDVFERDLALIGVGAEAHIEVSAFPGEHLMGRVSFVYPVVDVNSRTNRVRISLPNPGTRLKPGMFATIFVDAVIDADALAAPLEAVVVTGERNLVFVQDDQGMLQPREVVLGAQAGDYVEILGGLSEGERIVAAANFLVDAESRLGTTGSSMPGMQHGAMEPGSQEGDSAPAGGHVHD